MIFEPYYELAGMMVNRTLSSVDRYLHRSSPSGNGRAHKRPDPIQAVPISRRRRRPIEATYDLAQTTTENVKHWSQTDAYDADSANSRERRQIMVRRSRYETNNNGFIDGLTRTHSTFVIRKGPRLRLVCETQEEQDANQQRNDKIKRDWHKWCKAIQFRRKLWCMAHAKLQDGEPIAIVRTNPKVRHAVKLDLKLIETEQCQTPLLPYLEKNYIDGVKFDEFGNPVHYDILPQHPGALRSWKSFTPEQVDARFVLHWFELERPNQHRGIPGLKATLGLGAVGRRWREAVVASAETIADISLIVQTQGAPQDGADELAPFGAVEYQKRMMMMMPMGWQAFQPRGEQPPANYEMFNREHVSELARPVNMPYNLAAADSSRHSFASGKLDTIPYYMQIDDLDREDCNDLVLDPLFALWWEEYILIQHAHAEMLELDPNDAHDHEWDWARNPVADEASEVRTNAEKLRTGQASPSDIAHRNGESFEELLRRMSRDYGKTVDEIREALYRVNIAPKSGGTLGGPPREMPDANGEDAPTMEQMSMLVAELTEAVRGLQLIQAEMIHG